jgi:hypothetical protein
VVGKRVSPARSPADASDSGLKSSTGPTINDAPDTVPASKDTIRELAKVLRRHVAATTLEKIVNELLDVPGNRDFRDAIEALARELMRR